MTVISPRFDDSKRFLPYRPNFAPAGIIIKNDLCRVPPGDIADGGPRLFGDNHSGLDRNCGAEKNCHQPCTGKALRQNSCACKCGTGTGTGTVQEKEGGVVFMKTIKEEGGDVFPREVIFKAVFRNRAGIHDSLTSCLAESTSEYTITQKASTAANFVSFSINARFDSSEHLSSVCSMVGTIEGFVMMM